MDNIFLFVSVPDGPPSNSEWEKLVKSIEAMEGIQKESAGQKGLHGTEIFAVEVAKAGLLTKIAESIGGWLLKDRKRHLKLKLGENEIELFDVSNEDQEELIQWFQDQVKKHPSSKKR